MSSFICRIEIKIHIYAHIHMTQEQERIFWREEGDPHEKEVGPKGGNGEQILTNTIIYGYRKP